MKLFCSNSSVLSHLTQNDLHSPTTSSCKPDDLMFTFIDSTLSQRLRFCSVNISGILVLFCFFVVLFVCLFVFGLRVFAVALTLLRHFHAWPIPSLPSSVCSNVLFWMSSSLTILLKIISYAIISFPYLYLFLFFLISWYTISCLFKICVCPIRIKEQSYGFLSVSWLLYFQYLGILLDL